MNILAASREVSTPSSNPQIFNLHYAASGGEFDPKRVNTGVFKQKRLKTPASIAL